MLRFKNRWGSPNEIHKRLYELHSLNQLKIDKNEAIRLENIRKEEAKCTFHPRITDVSKKMAERPLTAKNAADKLKRNKGSKTLSVFDKLYENSKKTPPKEKTRKQIEDEKYFEECTFQPNIK